MNRRLIKISKFLSLILRHKPEIINLKINSEGWANIDELIKKTNDNGLSINYTDVKEIVEKNNKMRFKISNDEKNIRANQGHSININLNLKEKKPPNILYHGTTIKFIESIKENGLVKNKRHHVHLSTDKYSAINVGKRHGKPIVLEIDSKKMYQDGYLFYLSENLIWLTDKVLPKYLKIEEEN